MDLLGSVDRCMARYQAWPMAVTRSSIPPLGRVFSIGFTDFVGEMRKVGKAKGDVFSLMISHKVKRYPS